ncbi:MAG: branched-chain amino acid ABC transporter permease [Comamonadaceae bacterium]|nr:branched-chain amino acid ABC transporter permease [Comamonadaceae bacterium]
MSGYLSGLLAMLAVNVIVAYSVFVPGSAGLLNLGAAGFVLVGAYTAGALTSLFEVPLALAVILGSAMAGLVAFLIAFPILRTRGIYMVLATFAFAEVVAGVLLNIPALGGAAGLSVMAYAGLPVVIPCAIGTVAFVAWLMRTRFGLSVRAIHDDESVAHLFGVHLRMTQVIALTIGGAIGGLGGGLLIHQFNFIDVQSTGVLFSIYVLLYVLMGAAELDPSLKFLEGGRYIFFGVAVVIIMMLRPQGVITRTLIERLTPSHRSNAGAGT